MLQQGDGCIKFLTPILELQRGIRSAGLTAQVLMSFQRLRALTTGSVSVMVIGTLTRSNALLQMRASTRAPPLNATSSVVRLWGHSRFGASCRTSSRRATRRHRVGPRCGGGGGDRVRRGLTSDIDIGGDTELAEDGVDVRWVEVSGRWVTEFERLESDDRSGSGSMGKGRKHEYLY